MRNQALLNAIIENAIDGIITINEKGIVESINPSACRLFLYNPEEVIGKNISMLMPSPDREKHDSYIENYKASGIPHIIGHDRDVLGRKKDGNIFPFRLGVSEVKFEGERIFAGFIHDMSHQKEAENRLMQYTQHLEELVKDRTQTLNETIEALTVTQEEVSNTLEKEKELNKIKSRLLSMASHEFRTPLSTIQLSTALIQRYVEDVNNPKIETHIHKIKSAIANLTAILNDFLLLEKAESNKIILQVSSFNLQDFIKEVIGELKLLTKKKQKIICVSSTEVAFVKLDKNLLKNCIINLVSNAIKYSGEETEIELWTAITDNAITINVKDNGIGIPEEDHKHLFEAFFRAHNTGNIPGTGLGLHIVSRYVSLMKGTISFKSAIDKGTLFTIELPRYD
ncbi:PAS domain-containing sensor histidine kinase [Flavobacterium sp. 1355]|jgi:two-component system, LuxR family, sensor kinase FixL|uniref:PAS domain-containing sensor histidine kinase n=1 Tax=Flavobacterium sp. 1355 TaxID=2806571 RepID=UPI001AE336FE|nr:PAS domain-containing sensor histidine kinase [Flavobacterium sp. 1355]MBP1223045.1 PAS domain S-box-containing protein [Flavobacterium sp. 1355]